MNDTIRHGPEYRACVEAMRTALQAQDGPAFHAAVDEFNAVQNSTVMVDVRKVAGTLQVALEQFRNESRLLDLAERQVPDARHRLAHVLRLTDDAAHHTMDLVDQSCPLVDAVAHEAERLQLLIKRPLGPDEGLRADLERFLVQSLHSMQTVRARLADVLLAQGYQDLSGQIIRSVMKLVDELEQALGDLVRIGNFQSTVAAELDADSSRGHGPVVPGIEHGQAVNGQQDVDAMLSGLGM
ncbi:MAG TPA: protein phosphatase CheZ [Steroidobacteraceae bacterium]